MIKNLPLSKQEYLDLDEFIRHFSYKYANHRVPEADLQQEAWFKIWQVPTPTNPTVGYYCTIAKRAIWKYHRKNCRTVNIVTTKEDRTLYSNKQKIWTDFRPLTQNEISQIAKEFNVSERNVSLMNEKLHWENREINLDIYMPESNISVEQELIYSEETNELYQAINNLEGYRQRLIYDYYFNDIPLVDIAKEERVSPQAIDNRKNKILKNLRKQLTN